MADDIAKVLSAVNQLSSRFDAVETKVEAMHGQVSAATTAAGRAVQIAQSAQSAVLSTAGQNESVLATLANVTGTLQEQNKTAETYAGQVIGLSGKVETALIEMKRVTTSAEIATQHASLAIESNVHAAQLTHDAVKAAADATSAANQVVKDAAAATLTAASQARLRHAVTIILVVLGGWLTQRLNLPLPAQANPAPVLVK